MDIIADGGIPIRRFIAKSHRCRAAQRRNRVMLRQPVGWHQKVSGERSITKEEKSSNLSWDGFHQIMRVQDPGVPGTKRTM